MMTVPVGPGLLEIVMGCYAAGLPLLIEGSHGLGKSELLTQAAQKIGIGCIVCDLSLLEAVDLVGLPERHNGVTRYCPPAFLPTSGSGLLIFEELNRAQPQVRAPTLQLLTARRLNSYVLPEGWLPVAAVNPSGADYDVSELDPALLSRFVKIGVTADRQEWVKWAKTKGVHPVVIAYVETDRNIFDDPESNPRAWKYVSDFLLGNPDLGPASPSLQAAISGLIGDKRGASFLKFLKDRVRPLKAEEILNAYPENRKQITSWVKSGKLDLVQGSLWAVETYLQASKHFQAIRNDREGWANLGQFIADLPGDIRETAEEFFEEHKYPLPPAPKRKKS